MKHLSRQLQDFITQRDKENELDDPETLEIVRKVLNVIAGCRESFTEGSLVKIHEIFSDAEQVRAALDYYYARRAVENIPGTVDRMMKLDPMIVKGVPNEDVRVYITEATRCCKTHAKS